MKILLGYNYYTHSIDVQQRVEAWLDRLRVSGFDVEGFVLTLTPPGPAMKWEELDRRWRNGDKLLISMYERLISRIAKGGFDVFVNANGSAIHPEFVPYIPAITVYSCFDDPESSYRLSRPVASAFDMSMVGNIACLDMYHSWGAEFAYWWPIGHHPSDYDHTLVEEDIRTKHRRHDLTILCERVSPWRKVRLDKIARAFPQGKFYGKGWPNGFLPESKRVSLLQNTKIGVNIHNSIGPVNSRTFVLPANGVMQLCDNKSHLAEIYDLGTEVIGYESMEEAIELCNYYLQHEKEREEIAINGWKRAIHEYNEIAVFQRLIDAVIDFGLRRRELRSLPSKQGSIDRLYSHRRKTTAVRMSSRASDALHRFSRAIKKKII